MPNEYDTQTIARHLNGIDEHSFMIEAPGDKEKSDKVLATDNPNAKWFVYIQMKESG